MTSKSSFNINFIGDFLSKLAEKSEGVYWLSSPDFKHIIYVSPAYEKIWGRSREILYKNPEVWITYLHPDDVENYHPIHAMAEKMTVMGPDARYEESYRIVRPDGEIRWIIDRGFPIYENGICQGVTGVAIDVTKDKLHELELQKAKEKAEKANEAKTLFLATMSHELRTPLNGVLGMAQILEMTKLNKDQKEYLANISESGKHLLSLVNDMLDFAKLESGKMQIFPAPVDLKVLIEEIAGMFSYQTKEKGIDLLVSYLPSLPHLIVADSRAIRQVIFNLLGNAIKFTDKGRVILNVNCLKRDEKKAKFKIEVIDTGIGIPKDKLKLIFERFTQVDSSYSRRHGGTGLGLAITQKLVDLMGGKINVESEMNKGSTFSCVFDFPLQKESLILSPWDNYKNHVRIMIVDDSNRGAILAKHLETSNVDVTGSENVVESLIAAHEENNDFQIIFVDEKTRIETAYSLAKKIKAQKKIEQPLMMLMCESLAKSTLDKAKREGFFDCLTKPIQPQELLIAITAAWEKWVQMTKKDKNIKDKKMPYVLLVEDNLINQKVTKVMLDNLGCKTDVVDEGKKALSLVETKPYDLIFMDINLPDISGYEVTQSIRKNNSKCQKKPIIGLTANAFKNDVTKCQKAGMNDVITKPFEQKRLAEIISLFVK